MGKICRINGSDTFNPHLKVTQGPAAVNRMTKAGTVIIFSRQHSFIVCEIKISILLQFSVNL